MNYWKHSRNDEGKSFQLRAQLNAVQESETGEEGEPSRSWSRLLLLSLSIFYVTLLSYSSSSIVSVEGKRKNNIEFLVVEIKDEGQNFSSFCLQQKGIVQLLRNRAPPSIAGRQLCDKLKINIDSTAIKSKVLNAKTYFADAFK